MPHRTRANTVAMKWLAHKPAVTILLQLVLDSITSIRNSPSLIDDKSHFLLGAFGETSFLFEDQSSLNEALLDLNYFGLNRKLKLNKGHLMKHIFLPCCCNKVFLKLIKALAAWLRQTYQLLWKVLKASNKIET